MAIDKVAMIGADSLGGGMALLLAENGVSVCLQDLSEETVDGFIKSASEQGIKKKLSKHENYGELCASVSSPRIIFFSLPHGPVGGSVVEGLHPCLNKENWWLKAARRGPSMCPGEEEKALDIVMPLFQKMTAKAEDGSPCVAKIGEGGAGHYVKMIHNGIEYATMSPISESWTIMNKHIGMEYDEIGKVFEKWSSEGELKKTFLVKIGADSCKQKDRKGRHFLGDVQDKVVQDIDDSEGTGIWSNTQATSLHVPAPTLSTAHYLRIGSAYRGLRQHVKETFHGSCLPLKINFRDGKEHEEFIEDLRKVVYTTCLASYVQGMSIIDIWRAGCIIQADHISDLLSKIFHPSSDSKHKNPQSTLRAKYCERTERIFPATKEIGNERGGSKCMSATFEYLKYSGNLELPTQFYEAELDSFGKHMYDIKSLDKGLDLPETGKHHFEWKPP